MTLKKTELKRDVDNTKVKLSRIRTRCTSRLQLTETKLWNRSMYFWQNPYRSYVYQGQQTHSKNLWITYDQLKSSKKRRFYFFLSNHSSLRWWHFFLDFHSFCEQTASDTSLVYQKIAYFPTVSHSLVLVARFSGCVILVFVYFCTNPK